MLPELPEMPTLNREMEEASIKSLMELKALIEDLESFKREFEELSERYRRLNDEKKGRAPRKKRRLLPRCNQQAYRT